MVAETLPQTAPIEPTTPIKPSEAIRLGCLVSPVQLFDDVYVSAGGQASCVYGAMALGRGYSPNEASDVADEISLHIDLPCPACTRFTGFDPLIHLNDDHKWSRERIADWLAEQGL